jgi:GDPmannose 4,6-dehydratase
MYLMLQQSDPIDCVLATGNTYSVRDFVELAFAEIGVNIRWQGKDLAEQGVDDSTGHVVVKINPKFYRPTEVDLLIGDPALAKSKLGWTSKTNLKDLCSMMVRRDIERIQSS